MLIKCQVIKYKLKVYLRQERMFLILQLFRKKCTISIAFVLRVEHDITVSYWFF